MIILLPMLKERKGDDNNAEREWEMIIFPMPEEREGDDNNLIGECILSY